MLVAGLFLYVLRHLSNEAKIRDDAMQQQVQRMAEMSDKRDAVIDRLADRFTAATTSAAQSFEQTAVTIHRETRESSERRERELHQLVRQVANLAPCKQLQPEEPPR